MKNDGGPAFPLVVPEHWPPMRDGCLGYSGMSLRDWFAGMAREEDIELHQEHENLLRYREYGNNESGTPLYPPCTRQRAKFLYADAMLKAREVGDED